MARTDDGLDVATLRRLHELTARINGCPTLAETLQAVVDGVVEVVGFDAAVLNRRMPDGEFEVVTAAGSAQMCAQLLGSRYPADTWQADLAVAEHWGTLRFIPADRVPERTVDIMWIPDIEPTDDPDKWHANDLLYAPLCSPSGDLVGMLSVDLPRGGRRPGPAQRDLLQMFAAQAGTAVDNARLTEQLRSSEEAFRLAFESAGTGMAVLTLSGTTATRFSQVNPALCRILGRTPADVASTRLLDVTHADDRGTVLRAVEALSSGSHDVQRPEVRWLRPQGTEVWVALTLSAVRPDDGTPVHAVCQVDDVTRRRAAADELRRRASQDPLTGLLNRHAMHEQLVAAVEDAQLNGRPGAVLFCDLDGFKRVNDEYGHAAGDRVLAVIARRLCEASRAQDAVGRLGGDEFVIVARGVEAAQAELLASRLRVAVDNPVTVDGSTVQVGLSVGVAILSRDTVDAAAVLRAADEAMYRDKPDPEASSARGAGPAA